jgi:enoyl-CoA hydratase/carnithine racemase
VPVIAAVNGAAYAGGLELVLHCDFAYASRKATFALTEVSLGIMPGGGGTQTLPRAVGERRAKELILAARAFSAEEALAWGVVNKLCDAGKVLEHTLEAAGRIASLAPLAVRQAKHAIRRGLQMDLPSAMRFEVEAYNRLVGTEDRREGLRAFNEKRKAKFKGR